MCVSNTLFCFFVCLFVCFFFYKGSRQEIQRIVVGASTHVTQASWPSCTTHPTQVLLLAKGWWEDPLEKEMATLSNALAWKIPWMEEPGRLRSMGSQRVGHDWATSFSFSRGGENEEQRKGRDDGWHLRSRQPQVRALFWWAAASQ